MTPTKSDMAATSAASADPSENTDLKTGLSSAEAAERLARYGENAIAEKRQSVIEKLFSYFWGPIPWMIEVAAILSAAAESWDDFAVIVFMLLVNAGVGFWQEFRADNAIDALKQQLAPNATTLRDGQWLTLPARNLVPGDVVRVALGNIVPADMSLGAGDYLSVDQSALTGESLPVDKQQGDDIYSGSIVKLGEMIGVVTATGMKTYFGKTASLVESAGTVSHFQRAVLRIGNVLILATLGLVALILIVALFRGDPPIDTLLFALILTVAAIPVALPAVLSVTMAVGAERLARLRAIVSRLVSIEELAGMDILCSDKTGTLTRNELTLGDPVLFGAKDEDELVFAAALASGEIDADAIDTAVRAGLDSPDVLEGYDVDKFVPFDPISKRAEATIQHGVESFKASKGAPQVILALAKPDKATAEKVTAAVDAAAARGLRTLGVARTAPGKPAQWTFLGLITLFDPPREDAAATIAKAENLGLDIKMVTGDHEAIAREIAGTLGLGNRIVPADTAFAEGARPVDADSIEQADGFARVLPEHKYAIVRALQADGHIVGMTGDGVNDAPALKQADAGVAVSGASDAARAAADLVLTAPGLSVITTAMEEARRIFARMNSYTTYRVAETIRVLLFMTLSILVFNFYPVTAIMIVLLALLNDLSIMTIAYDNAIVAPKPVRWDMTKTLSIAAVLGAVGVIETFILFWYVERVVLLDRGTIQTLIFLKLLVSGHLTLYLTRNDGPIWQRPWPSWRLLAATESTQVLGTLAAVYGFLISPVGWGLALAVWGYALVVFLIESAIKIAVVRLLAHHGERGLVSRTHRPLFPHWRGGRT